MANIMQNRVDAILDPKQMDIITKSIQEITKQIPDIENLTLTANERGSILSLDVDNKVFVEDTIAAIKRSGNDIMPVFIKPAQIQNDLTLFTQMDELHAMLLNALQQVSDVRRIAASEAMNVANIAYGIFQIAAQSGLPGAQAAFDKLKERYKDLGIGAPQKTD